MTENEIYAEAAGLFERWRVTNPASYTELVEDAGGAEQARSLFIQMAVDGINDGIAKERKRCLAICELTRGLGKPGIKLAQELVQSGATAEEALERMLESEGTAPRSFTFNVITSAPKECN